MANYQGVASLLASKRKGEKDNTFGHILVLPSLNRQRISLLRRSEVSSVYPIKHYKK